MVAYVIWGYIRVNGSGQASINVNVKNNNTSDDQDFTTSQSGMYAANIGYTTDYPGGYANDHVILVTALGYSETVVVSGVGDTPPTPGLQRDINIETRDLSSNFSTNIGEADLSSVIRTGAFIIRDVVANPSSVQRSGSTTTELRCDWFDNADLVVGSYTCLFYVRGPYGTVYGPFTGSNTKEGSKEYHATYDWDPPGGAELGDYDLKAVVYKL